MLGITWAQIRAKIVKALGTNGETIMKALETGFDIVVALVKGGIGAAWELIKEKLTNLKDMVVDGIIGFVTDTIVKKAIPKLISMFIPGAGFISAILSIYDTIKVFVEKLSKIVAVVKAFVDSIVAIAAGQIAGAANRVESALAGRAVAGDQLPRRLPRPAASHREDHGSRSRRSRPPSTRRSTPRSTSSSARPRPSSPSCSGKDKDDKKDARPAGVDSRCAVGEEGHEIKLRSAR